MKSILALAIVAALCACGGNSPAPETVSPQADPEVTAGLRTMALTGELPLKAAPDEPILVIVDTDRGIVGTTVVATMEGDASLYTTKGGAILGGGGVPHIRAAAQKLVRVAANHIGAMTPTTSYPFPTNGNVRFYVRTPKQVYTAEAPLAQLEGDGHPLASLFGASMDVALPLQDLDKGQ